MMTNGTTPDTPLSILLVEQDINWGRFFQSYLEHKGFEVSLSTDGLDAWQRIVKGQHNFCILNPDLPTMDGCALAEHIREQTGHIPIVFMASAQQASEDTRLNCFRAGADDFIVRPCSLEEIRLRINTIQKRFRFCPIENDYRIFDLGRLRFDHAKQRLFNQDCSIRLTTKEAELLLALCLNRGKVLERDRALLAVWKSAAVYNVRSMDVYISKLRRLLFQYTYSEILNVHGVGFKLLTHRDAGFRRILRRDAGHLRQRVPDALENGSDSRLEAVAVATGEDGLVATVEERVEPVLREPDGVVGGRFEAEATSEGGLTAMAGDKKVAPVLRKPGAVVSCDPTCDPTSDPTGDSTSDSAADSAGEPPVATDEPMACDPPVSAFAKHPVSDGVSMETSMRNPTVSVAEKPVVDDVGSDGMACDPPCYDPTGDSVTTDGGLADGLPLTASVPPPSSSDARSASSD